MFSRKWEKARPFLSGCPKRCKRTFWFSHGQRIRLAGYHLRVLVGLTILLCGCSLDSAIPGTRHWYPDPFNPMFRGIQPSITYLAADASSRDPLPEHAVKPAEPLLNNNKTSAGAKPPQQHVPAGQEQKPAILVPEVPNKDNGQVIVTYKSKIEETQNLLRTITESQLTKEQHDTYISINSFLEKSREAFSQDDLSMAMNLAEKAHTLAKEIADNSVSQ